MNMKESEFTLCPIEINQSVFDKELYREEGKHSWNGCLIKIDLLLECLRTSAESYILFTDVDLIVKSDVYKNLKSHMDADQTMVFLEEGEHLNIGFILLKVCPDVIGFWSDVREAMIKNPGHDQKYVNDMICNYKGLWTKFDNQIFTCSNIWNGTTEFSVLQPLSSCLGKEFDFAEKIFTAAQHIDVNDYMRYVPEGILPYIYQFQELLFRAHQESSPAVNS